MDGRRRCPWAGSRVVAEASVALAVSSPLYAGTYDYAAQHDLRFTDNAATAHKWGIKWGGLN
jgi:hypothetical protein